MIVPLGHILVDELIQLLTLNLLLTLILHCYICKCTREVQERARAATRVYKSLKRHLRY